jgi:hypothetical protein
MIREFIFNSPYRKLRFETYCAKKKFLDIVTNQFSKSLIALGHWKPKENSPISRLSVPSKKFLELLEKKNPNISVIDEFNTSQLCSLCDNRLYKYDEKANVVKDSFKYSQFRYCVFCDIIFDRDNNASVNIGNLKVYEKMNQPRPSIFTRQGNRNYFQFVIK